jgi:hypothetical protein
VERAASDAEINVDISSPVAKSMTSDRLSLAGWIRDIFAVACRLC